MLLKKNDNKKTNLDYQFSTLEEADNLSNSNDSINTINNELDVIKIALQKASESERNVTGTNTMKIQ